MGTCNCIMGPPPNGQCQACGLYGAGAGRLSPLTHFYTPPPVSADDIRRIVREEIAAALGQQRKAQPGVVYVCAEKDSVCGERPANWCADCPMRGGC